MRLKKVMAIMLAAGLTVGSIALASTADGGKSLNMRGAQASPAAAPGIIGSTDDASTPSEAPSEAPSEEPSEAPSENPSEAPSENPSEAPSESPTTSPDTPTTSPSADPGTNNGTTKKPAKVTVTKKNVTGKSGKIVVTVNKVSGAKGYQIQYATKKNFKNKTNKSVAKFSAKTKKVTIKNLKKGTYYVRIRAYKKSNGSKVWGNFSKTISVKVTK